MPNLGKVGVLFADEGWRESGEPVELQKATFCFVQLFFVAGCKFIEQKKKKKKAKLMHEMHPPLAP